MKLVLQVLAKMYRNRRSHHKGKAKAPPVANHGRGKGRKDRTYMVKGLRP
jgi:hypothetical protein